jgi:hypothetical protein
MRGVNFKVEQFITRTRIQAAQGRFWLKHAVGLWVLFAVVAFVLACGSEERKREVVPWVIGSLSPLKTMQWRGERYHPREVARYLNVNVYQGTLGEWAVWCFGVGLLPVMLIGTGAFRWARKREPNETHVRGAQVVSTAELQRVIGKGKGIEIAGVTIPEDLRRSHALICGSTGSGKSTVIRKLLRQYEARGEPCIVFDPELEFVREFYNPDRGDYLLNPVDARYPGWSPWRECETETDIEALAASLFPVTTHTSDAAAYYHTAAQILFSKTLEKLPPGDPRDLPAALEKAAQRQPKILSTLENGIASFRHLAPGTGQGWSAREWVANPKGWVFLTVRETDKEALLPILSLWLDTLTRRLLTAPIAPIQTINLVIDELAALREQPTLERLLNQGRKRGVSCVIGFQNFSQLKALYGESGVVSLLDAPATRLLLKANNTETQEWCARNIGEREVVRTVESETVGPENVRDSLSRSHQRKVEEAVLGSQFGLFKNLTGVLKVAHYGSAWIKIPYAGMEEKQPAFLPVAQEKASDQKGSEREKQGGGQAARLKRTVNKERRKV